MRAVTEPVVPSASWDERVRRRFEPSVAGGVTQAEVADLAALVVRCPGCRSALVARMGRRGPCYPCRCFRAPRHRKG